MEKAVSKTKEDSLSGPGKNLRYERKFIFSGLYLEDLVQQLYLNSFGFKEVFDKRRINNVYFDDQSLNFYKQNVAGVGKREKFRLRWYGDDFSQVENPAIEIKKKFGEVGDKITHKLKDLAFDLNAVDAFKITGLITDKLDNHPFLKNKFYQLRPTLFNSYERRYFLSFCNKFRVTLDFHQRFYDPNYVNHKSSEQKIEDNVVVLELKYNLLDDYEARSISQEFGPRVSRNSKYVQGIDLVRHYRE